MDKKGAEASLVVVQLLMFLFFNFGVSDHATQLQLLLSFKSSIHDPSGFLSNWDSSATFCRWHGITCNNLSHVRTLDLSAKNLSGELVSSSIFHLPFIETLNLSSNQFYGEIPQDVYSSTSLRFLNLSNNNFTGQIPSGSIFRLEVLDLSNNLLSGKISQEIGKFYSLKFLDLGGNVLAGEIPISISNITALQFLTLASNQLVGPIPRGLGKMKSLKWIYLGYNNLSGEIPKEIGTLTSLNHLDLVYNNLTGQIPSSLGNLSDLQYLFLYQNKLTGSIPKSIFGLKKLVSLDLSDNSLSGEISELIIQLQNLEILHLFGNSLTGKIPNALTSLPRLQILQLWSNRLSGEIPKSLGRHNNLTILDLSSNNLTGQIPEGLCSSGHLFKLILFSNLLEGVIPKNLSSCRSLERVRLQNNRLSGELSSDFTKLPLIYFLDISNNYLSGNIGEKKWDIPSLEMLNLARNRFSGKLLHSYGSQKIVDLDLSRNGFSGTIPRGFGSLTELMQLSLCGNKLTGEIPEELSSCKKLVSLDLSHNQLGGQIPSGFSEMPVLGQLDLSENQLTGEIPRKLGKMESLTQVNISYNHLHGRLPSTGAFLALNASAVAGNDLCGGDDANHLPPCKKVKNPAWWFFVACSLTALVLLALAAFVLVFIRGRNDLELKRVENADGIWEMQFFHSKVSESVIIDDIILSAKEVNVVSTGKEGMQSKGKSAINDLQFVVQELNDVSSIPSNFWSEITQFGKLQHPNIVKLIGKCRSEKGAYLVYEHIEGRILSDILHSLNWERRRNIAIGIAKALRFLHSCCSPSMLVGDMSPKKVIIDGKDEPWLRLSLPGLVCIENKHLISSAYIASVHSNKAWPGIKFLLPLLPNKSMHVHIAIFPVSSESRECKNMTEKSDIYGFGLILIELLTGKSPANAEFGPQQSLVEWARYCYADCHLDMWVDPMIRDHASNNKNQIIETMNLALHCTADDPTARPCAIDLSKTMKSALRITSCFPDGLKFSSPL